MARLRRFVPLALLVVAAACSSSTGSARPIPLRLGFFPNLTHAPALYGIATKSFARELGERVRLEPRIFAAGPEAVQALLAGDLDLAYLGPGPAVTAFQRSRGRAIRIVAGATSGGAALVTKPAITSPAALRGATIATPQLGNTQDIALRSYLESIGLRTDTHGGGDVHIRPQNNAQTLQTFKSGAIDGAWVPEPYASVLVTEGGHVLVDERTLWPGGRFATTVLVVRTAFLRAHPEVVERFLRSHVAAIRTLVRHPDARQVVNTELGRLTGSRLAPIVLDAAWSHLAFTWDPLVDTIKRSARAAARIGFLENADVRGIADLRLLQRVLAGQGLPSP